MVRRTASVRSATAASSRSTCVPGSVVTMKCTAASAESPIRAVCRMSGAVQPRDQLVLHGQPGGGGVAVARQVHHRVDEAAERIGLQEQPQLAAGDALQDAADQPDDGLHRRPEQLGAGVPGEQVQRPLTVVGVGRGADREQHLVDHPAQHRGRGHLGVERPGGQDAQEADLADRLAAVVVDPHRQVERRQVLGQRGHRGRLGRHHQAEVVRGADGGGEAVRVGVVAEQAEAGLRLRDEPLVAGDLVVLLGAEEGQVALGQPVQQIGGLDDLLRRAVRRVAPDGGRGGRGPARRISALSSTTSRT